MRIVFNASNLLIGGGRRIGTGIISALYNLPLEDEIHIFLPKKPYYSFESTTKIKIHYLPSIITNFLPGFLVSVFILFQLNKIKPNAIFSLGNYAIPTNKKQLLLLQWPYAVYPESIVWTRMNVFDYLKRKFRLFLFKRTLKYASSLTVQTELMKSRLRKHIHYKGSIEVVESSGRHFNIIKKTEPDFTILNLKKSKEEKLLLFISEYYTHKNLEVMIPLAMLIKEYNLPFKILLTLDKSNSDVTNLFEQVNNKKLDQIIINLGRIEQEQAFAVYKSCDVLLFPTLLESYGFPYLEAAYCKLPICTSNLDFARNLNGENAWYFDPLSANSILATLQQVFADPELTKKKVEGAFEQVKNIPSWEEITNRYLEIIKQM